MSPTNRSGDVGSVLGALLGFVLEGFAALGLSYTFSRRQQEHPGDPFATQGAGIVWGILLLSIPFVVMFGMVIGRIIVRAAGRTSSSSTPSDEMPAD